MFRGGRFFLSLFGGETSFYFPVGEYGERNLLHLSRAIGT